MGGLFQGRCGDNARATVRLAFHDAGTSSLALQANAVPNGGADESMLVDPTEVQRAENDRLQNIVSFLQPIPAQFGVSLATSYISPAFSHFLRAQLMALIGTHTTGNHLFVDTAEANNTFDTTVDIWDTRFCTFKLDSDVAFSTDPSTSPDFTRFIGTQTIWTTDYAAAHEKISLLGLDVTDFTDCSEILPVSIDLAPLAEITTVGGGSNKPVTDPLIDPIKLEAAIQ
ncbi:heme peroxidase [Mycena albidolilacea]|uniref:Heme peroxidase n=1 Tax=Mycena albidolilacea TaxID=1033008 RepID=A0AAD6ZGA6_9AGAR|nr:heme peroxidase [Mycena albidolilacea]